MVWERYCTAVSRSSRSHSTVAHWSQWGRYSRWCHARSTTTLRSLARVRTRPIARHKTPSFVLRYAKCFHAMYFHPSSLYTYIHIVHTYIYLVQLASGQRKSLKLHRLSIYSYLATSYVTFMYTFKYIAHRKLYTQLYIPCTNVFTLL